MTSDQQSKGLQQVCEGDITSEQAKQAASVARIRGMHAIAVSRWMSLTAALPCRTTATSAAQSLRTVIPAGCTQGMQELPR